ncbi:heterokaryon incompatibility protein het-E-1 [Fusarium mundagurra]|uniref:Heterokaryon incompatibility protein het-E-1 n=1 Tax=Fusarium mundagurra TaxID=1567541 RepID=A0A8H5Z7A5_9HYPO|nr:heterokaryon incompatibility protein het-E-1 [Fusarium mundagurra]
MKQLSKLKKKLKSSDSANQQSSRPASVPAAASTSQIATPSCHQSTGSSLTVSVMSSSAEISPSFATTEPATVLSPSPEPENAIPSVPERLWSKAYNVLEEEEPEIVKSYREILIQVQREWDDTTAPEEIQYLEHCKTVKSRQMWRLVYSGLEKSKRQAKYKENLSTIIETINNIKGVVDKVVKYSSEAAIAWVGVSLGLEILSNPMKEPGLNRKGIAYVLSRMEWYWNLAELVLYDNSNVSSAALRTNLETQIIEFYKTLLLFQMRSTCLYYRNWAGVILRDAVKLDDWAEELNTIKDSERLIRKDIEQYDNQDIRLKLGTIETSAVGQAESLETICKILREEARLEEKKAQDDKDKDCLASLLITDPRMDKKRIQSQKGDPLKESYEWILKSEAYQTFIDDASSRVLWINGPPGKGKTMLLCGIIDELQKNLRPISFFFCQANVKEEDLSSDIAVLRGLVYVLLEHQPSLISAIRPSYDKQKDRLFNSINSSQLLREILTTMLQDPRLHDTILLVDALDECTINRSKLTNLIVELSESCNNKWIVSSRNWPEIQQELADVTGLISLDLEQEHESVSQAVKSYISKKVDELAKAKWKNDSELKEKVFDYMQSHADDTFLWVALVCERLANSGIRKRLVMEELVRFPTSLGALYQAMLDRITNSSEADRLKQILALVCVVYRPLKSAEIPTLVESMDEYNEDDVKDTIASCGSFLTLQDDQIFFVHQSAKEFLLDQGQETLFPRGKSYQHGHIFSRSVEAMENTLRQDVYNLGSPGILNPVEIPRPDPLSSIEYSCVYWAQHLCKSDPLKEPYLSNLKRVLNFLQMRFTYWLEALSLLRELSTGITSIMALEAILVDMEMQELTDFIYDARRFIYHHKPAIEIAPLQVYASALIFSPQSSVIRKHFSSHIPEWIIARPEMNNQWDSHTQTIYTSSSPMHASYSPDGRYLAVSSHGCLDIYETASGDLIHQEDTDTVASVVAYSPDGLLLCCAVNGGIAILDATTLRVERKLELGTNPRQCLFLPDGNSIILVYRKNVAVFNWKSGEYVSRLDRIIRDFGNAAAALLSHIVALPPYTSEVRIWDLFTGNYGHWVAAAAGCNARLWYLDARQGWVYMHDLSHQVWDETGDCAAVLKGHSKSINLLSVYESQLASGSNDGTIKLWDLSETLSDQVRQNRRSSVPTYDSSLQPSEQNSCDDRDLQIDSLLFSPAGNICTNILFSGGASGPNGISFTPDDRLVAMKDRDGKFGVWDTKLMTRIHSLESKDFDYVAISSDGRRILPPKVLAIFDVFGLEVLDRKSGYLVSDRLKDYDRNRSGEEPLAFSRDNEWLLTYQRKTGSIAIRRTTSPHIAKDIGSLQADAPPYDTPELEEPFWRVPTRYGLLAVGEPSDFEGTRRIGWDYRRMALDVKASRVAFVCPSGQIKIIRFQ